MDQQPLLFKLAHLSDLHFSQVSFSLKSLVSKESIGNLNLLLHRKKTYRPIDSRELIETFRQEQITHVLVTGDLTTTSSKKEFVKAQKFIELLEREKFPVFTIPGNHDNYTKNTDRNKTFYDYFNHSLDPCSGYELKTHKTAAHYLGDKVWLVLMDTTKPAPIHYSTGSYSYELDKNLKGLLATIPQDDVIVILNHFPLLDMEPPRRRLIGSSLLQDTLKSHSNVKLYLHGHTHKPFVQDCRGINLPIILDSGSLTHCKKGSWNSVEVYPNGFLITNFRQTAHSWAAYKHFSFAW